MITVLIGVSLLSGCKNEEAERKATYREQGINFMEKGDYVAAISSFEAALKQGIGSVTKNDLDICYYKAAAQYASGNTEAALATYHAIIDFEETSYEAYYLRGCLYCKQGNIEAAKADFANAVKYASSEYELYLNIYENLTSAGDIEAGKEYLNKGLLIKGGAVTDLEYRGKIHSLLGEYDTAVLELEEAITAGSKKANLYLGKIYETTGEKDKAEACYKAYITAVPADAEALNELGEIMLERKLYKEAVDYFELAKDCQVIENKRTLMRNLIIAYEFNGNFDKAWDMVQEYVTLFPEDAEAQREYVFLKNRQMKGEIVEEIPESELETEGSEIIEESSEGSVDTPPAEEEPIQEDAVISEDAQEAGE